MHYFTPKRCEQSRKIIYHDKAQAEHAAREGFIERGTELWVYRCQFCGGWHLTHHDPQQSAALAAMRAGNGGGAGRKPRSRKRGFKPRRR